MNTPNAPLSEAALEALVSRKLIDLFIRVGLIALLVAYCYQIFRPFISLTLWSVILAVALYPLHVRVARKIRGRQGLAATVLISALFLVVLVPTTLLSISFADSITHVVEHVREGKIQAPAPPESVAHWPVVGKKLHSLWFVAHTNLGQAVAQFAPKVRAVISQFLAYARSAGTAMLSFLVSSVLAGIWMAYAASGHAAAIAIANRMAGPDKGEALVTLATATIRAVAQGVVGIACIQALLLGAGFILVGIPGAGILALLVLLLGIVQIPALLISLPAVVYVFSTNDSAFVAVIFAVYSLVAGSIDNVLKPLMLGRGVEAPMPIILSGALGGMVSTGIIGLFLGAVILALGYQLFMAWVYRDAAPDQGRGIRNA